MKRNFYQGEETEYGFDDKNKKPSF